MTWWARIRARIKWHLWRFAFFRRLSILFGEEVIDIPTIFLYEEADNTDKIE